MPSEIQVANAALLRIGEQPIQSFTADGGRAPLANATFAIYRDALLRSHPWNFAMERQDLAADATAPVWEYAYAYTRSGDPYDLRVLKVEDPDNYGFKIEGRKIVTDLGPPLNVVYLKRVTDPYQWDSLFAEAFISKLAMEWAEPCAKDAELIEKITKEFEAKIQAAFGVDGQEGSTELIPEGSWIEANC